MRVRELTMPFHGVPCDFKFWTLQGVWHAGLWLVMTRSSFADIASAVLVACCEALACACGRLVGAVLTACMLECISLALPRLAGASRCWPCATPRVLGVVWRVLASAWCMRGVFLRCPWCRVRSGRHSGASSAWGLVLSILRLLDFRLFFALRPLGVLEFRALDERLLDTIVPQALDVNVEAFIW